MFELTDNEAHQYAREHLEEVEVDAKQWSVMYRCPVTGRSWLLDYARSEYHGGGAPRLRQLDASGHPMDARGSHDPFK
jgi:hypothetical protein